jgi:hypothetical protein
MYQHAKSRANKHEARATQVQKNASQANSTAGWSSSGVYVGRCGGLTIRMLCFSGLDDSILVKSHFFIIKQKAEKMGP